VASSAQTRERLDPEVFRLPVERIRQGYYSDAYFNFTRDLLVDQGRHPQVTVQVFQKQHSVLGGIDEAIAVLKLCADDWTGLEVRALHEADEIEPWEPVLQIDGDYSLFAHLETVYLGVVGPRMWRARSASRRTRRRPGGAGAVSGPCRTV
jgi:nicotinate phosphoribosyltransferase